MTINIWNLTLEETKTLAFGTRVQAGLNGDMGTFLGVKPSGTIVVAWDYLAALKDAKAMARLVEYALT